MLLSSVISAGIPRYPFSLTSSNTASRRGYSYSNRYDYYLARGYAVVEASGIGTYGSEGYELCGRDLERDSHKCVVEWLTGNRIAYTDTKNNIQIKADWSNGNIAMVGKSYGGTLPFEVATTGVKGLKTIIPYAGIASWYDYTNSQGIKITSEVGYTDHLASFNCGGLSLMMTGQLLMTAIDPGYGRFQRMKLRQMVIMPPYGLSATILMTTKKSTVQLS